MRGEPKRGQAVITVSCGCGERFQVADAAAGQRASCPACGRVHRVGDDEEFQDVEAGPKGTSRKAVASLVLGLLSFLCTILTGLPAIILGIVSLRDIERSYGRLTGRGLAITGIITGSIGTLITFVFIPISIGLLLPAVQKVRGAANRMQSM